MVTGRVAWVVECDCGYRIDGTGPPGGGKAFARRHRDDEHEPRYTEGCALIEADRPAAWSVPGDLVGGSGSEWIEVVRLDALRETLGRCPCHGSPDA